MMLHVVCKPVFRCSKQRVRSFIICYIVHGSIDRIFQSIGTIMSVPLFSDIANYKKEIHNAKCNRRGDVVMQCHRH